MPRIVRGGLIQASLPCSGDEPIKTIKQLMLDKHVAFIEEGAKQAVQVLCLQELFYGPYFCAEQATKWYSAVEPVPDGPTTRLMQDLAKRFRMVIVVPLYEIEMTGVHYNTAAVIDADGTYLGKYRKHHIPQVAPGFWEKFYFCNPRGQIVAQGSRDQSELIVADLDLDMVGEVRSVWQFFRDRRPESYQKISDVNA